MLAAAQRREKIRSAAFTINGRVYVEGEDGNHAAGLRDLKRAAARLQEVITDIESENNGNR